jgi:hypothetical protein
VFTVAKAQVPASVAVAKQGFSQRDSTSGLYSNLSYGIVLANPSPDQDALDVTVLINAVDASNRLLQTKTERVSGVASASTFALGGSMSLRGNASRLELVVRMGARAPKALRTPPIVNAQIVSSSADPGYVRAITGELVNDASTMVIARAGISCVLFDLNGNVVGGGSGYVPSILPPGARAFFVASSGFPPIPVDRGVVLQVSVEPSYRPA